MPKPTRLLPLQFLPLMLLLSACATSEPPEPDFVPLVADEGPHAVEGQYLTDHADSLGDPVIQVYDVRDLVQMLTDEDQEAIERRAASGGGPPLDADPRPTTTALVQLIRQQVHPEIWHHRNRASITAQESRLIIYGPVPVHRRVRDVLTARRDEASQEFDEGVEQGR